MGIRLELLISVRNILMDGQRLLTLGCRVRGGFGNLYKSQLDAAIA